MSNWCWWEWGFKFSLLKDRLKKVELFNPKKLDSLYLSIETRACNFHDDAFEKGWWIKEFYKANMDFINEIMKILHWTTIFSRLIIFIVLFFWLNTIWIKYFNWTKLL